MTISIIYILGDGGHAKDIKFIIHRQPTDSWYKNALIRTLDDKDGDMVDAYLKEMARHGGYMSYLIGVNSSQKRREIASRMDKIYARPAYALVDPTAIVPSDAQTDGCVFGPYSVVSADATVGIHTHLNVGASINQGSYVGDFCTLSPGVRVCGDCTIGAAVQFGANSTVINLMNVGNNVILGAGAVVTNNIQSDVTAVGVPAKILYKTAPLQVDYEA